MKQAEERTCILDRPIPQREATVIVSRDPDSSIDTDRSLLLNRRIPISRRFHAKPTFQLVAKITVKHPQRHAVTTGQFCFGFNSRRIECHAYFAGQSKH